MAGCGAQHVSMRSCTVYMGSTDGEKPYFRDAAVAVGQLLANEQVLLVYGGGRKGLMGATADAVLAAGGQAVGIITDFLASAELSHTGLTRLETVTTMHERRLAMMDLGEAFIALPGGIGTLEELTEVVAWICQGRHRKVVGMLNVDQVYTPFLEMMQRAVEFGFVQSSVLEFLVAAETPQELVSNLLLRDGRLSRSAICDDVRGNARQACRPPAGAKPAESTAVDSPRPTCIIFAADTHGTSANHAAAAAAFGTLLANEGIDIVYDGACGGLAGTLADAALTAGGRVIGVVASELVGHACLHPGLTEIDIVTAPDTYAPSRRMFERGHWFVALPGGTPVWQELFDVLSAAQLGHHLRPMGVLNVDGYYDPLLQTLERLAKSGFVQEGFLNYVVNGKTPETLFAELKNYAPERVLKRVFEPEVTSAPRSRL